MKIVIDIPDFKWLENEGDFKEAVKEYEQGTRFDKEIRNALLNGTPLSEHHGDLIDVNVLKNNIQYVPIAPIFQDDYVTYRNVIFADILDMLPTIIEGSERE